MLSISNAQNAKSLTASLVLRSTLLRPICKARPSARQRTLSIVKLFARSVRKMTPESSAKTVNSTCVISAHSGFTIRASGPSISYSVTICSSELRNFSSWTTLKLRRILRSTPNNLPRTSRWSCMDPNGPTSLKIMKASKPRTWTSSQLKRSNPVSTDTRWSVSSLSANPTSSWPNSWLICQWRRNLLPSVNSSSMWFTWAGSRLIC